MRRALSLDPVSLNHRVVLAKVLYFRRKYEASLAELKEALRLDPAYPDALGNLGAVQVQRHAFDQAFRWLERARAEQDTRLMFLNVDPMYEPVRLDPRFTHLLAALGLR